MSGPEWLQISVDGALSGTPLAGDLGINTFLVKVEDNQLNENLAILTIEVVSLSDQQSGYTQWANDYGVVGGQQDDDDNDGSSNLYEYAFAGLPLDSSNKGIAPSVQFKGGVYQCVHLQRKDDINMVYSLESTASLSEPWTAVSGVSKTIEPFSLSYDKVIYEVPKTSPKLFFRFQISYP